MSASPKSCSFCGKTVSPPFLWYGFEDVGTDKQKVFCTLAEREEFYMEDSLA